MPELLTVDEAAEYLRLKPGAIYTQRHRGELPGALGFKVGRKLVFRRVSLESYLAEQESLALAGRPTMK
jgi:excisionase family DNA binding protein